MVLPIVLVVMIALVLAGRFFIVPATSPRPTNLGWRGADEGFRHCPNAMNCVSSTADQNTRFYVDPIPFSGSVESANSALVEVINNMERSQITDNTGDYIRVSLFSMGIY